MGKIALLPCDSNSRGKYLANRELPNNYMGDFTLMGFVVDRYHEALSLLKKSSYRLEKQQGGTGYMHRHSARSSRYQRPLKSQ